MSQKKYILIREPLSRRFDPLQWSEISSPGKKGFETLQNKILDNLLKGDEIFNKYFQMFYNNHMTIYQWYLLAKDNKYEIQEFLFRRVLSKSLQGFKEENKSIRAVGRQKGYKDKEKEKGGEKGKEKVKESVKTKDELKQIKQQKNEVLENLSQQIFYFMATKALTASLQVVQKPWNKPRHNKTISNNFYLTSNTTPNILKSRSRSKQNSQRINSDSINDHDFHDLYVQTLNACDGRKHMIYNAQKHLKGQYEKDKYNSYIRMGHRKKLTEKIMNVSHSRTLSEDIKNAENSQSSCFQYAAFGSVHQNLQKQQKQVKTGSKVFIRKIKSRNCGKFIRR